MHVERSQPTALQTAGNVMWLPAGLTLAFCHGVFGIFNAVTVVGLPFAYTHLLLAKYALWPFGVTFAMSPALRIRVQKTLK